MLTCAAGGFPQITPITQIDESANRRAGMRRRG